MAITWETVVAFALSLPKVEESTSYRTPALKVAGSLMARLRSEAEGGLVIMCALDEKEALLASGNSAYFTTPHYDGHGSVIVNLDVADPDEVLEMVVEAWRLKATKTLRKEWDATH